MQKQIFQKKIYACICVHERRRHEIGHTKLLKKGISKELGWGGRLLIFFYFICFVSIIILYFQCNEEVKDKVKETTKKSTLLK